jgi:hypothetical protein
MPHALRGRQAGVQSIAPSDTGPDVLLPQLALGIQACRPSTGFGGDSTA